jgi:hypothetical protein
LERNEYEGDAMSDRQVFVVLGSDEIYLGTVSELVARESASDTGEGISFQAIVADIVSELIADQQDDIQITIELR